MQSNPRRPNGEVPCPCGARQYRLLWNAVYERSRPVEYEYSLVRCNTCGLVRTLPVPDPAMYSAFDLTEADGSIRARPWLTAMDEDLEEFLAMCIAGLPILDLGCNTGELVATLVSHGYVAQGCDIDPAAVAVGRKRGLEVVVSNPEVAPLSGWYGGVLCIHTLEHTIQPTAILRNIANAMEVGAPLHIRVPNFGGLLPRLMRNRWGFLVPFQHTWQFTHRTLTELVLSTGAFEVAEIKSRVHLEPDSGGGKGLMKDVVKWSAAMLNASDEIRATFRRLGQVG